MNKIKLFYVNLALTEVAYLVWVNKIEKYNLKKVFVVGKLKIASTITEISTRNISSAKLIPKLCKEMLAITLVKILGILNLYPKRVIYQWLQKR